jgi:hypothetical protein
MSPEQLFTQYPGVEPITLSISSVMVRMAPIWLVSGRFKSSRCRSLSKGVSEVAVSNKRQLNDGGSNAQEFLMEVFERLHSRRTTEVLGIMMLVNIHL